MYKVLFVCTGNICRSPTGEGVMRHRINEEKLSDMIEVDSAGMIGYHVGEAPDHRAIDTAANRGISFDGQSARQVTENDYHEFDLLLAMDDGHLSQLNGKAPSGTEDKIVLFLDYVGVSKESEVPDPYYGSQQDFEYVLDLCEEGVDALIEKIQKENL